ncbi:DNA helicase [Tanacetum coccineum]
MCHPYYIGCIRGVSDLIPFGDPNKTQSTRRKIEIKNLNGNIIKLTLWNEMAKHFGQADFKKMDQPVIIAASSCRVSKYKDYQLAASPTTYYYLNPNIPEAQESCAFPDTKKLLRSLSVNFHIKTLKKRSLGTDTVKNTHGTEPSELQADPQKIPPEVLATQGKTSIFQFHFNTFANTVDLTLDEVFDVKTTDEGASSIVEQTYKGTSSVTPTIAVQSVENEEQEAKGKDKIAKEQTNKSDTYLIHLSFH